MQIGLADCLHWNSKSANLKQALTLLKLALVKLLQTQRLLMMSLDNFTLRCIRLRSLLIEENVVIFSVTWIFPLYQFLLRNRWMLL